MHVAGGGQCTWYDLAVAAFEATGTECVVHRTTAAEFGRPAPRPAYSVLRTERDDVPAPARLAGGPRRPPRRVEGLGMRLLVCGGAGFIGSTFVRQRVRDFGDEVTVLDKLTYAGRRENLQDVEHGFVHAGIEEPARVAEAMADADAVVNFAAETHVDRSIAEPDAFVTTHALGHLRAARGGPRARHPLRAGLHRRGLRLDRGGLVHRDLAAGPVLAVFAPPRRAPTCWSPPTATRSGWSR